jgi:hypothetical protein
MKGQPMTRTRIDVQLAAAATLLDRLAASYPSALGHLARELLVLDGMPDHTSGAGITRGAGSDVEALTAVERVAASRVHFSTELDTLREDAQAVIEMVGALAHMIDRAIGLRAPIAVSRCRDSLPGRDGGMDWGDPTCEEIPAKAGLCSACYQRERRWRIGEGLAVRDVVDAR